jgi:hypothetical protein
MCYCILDEKHNLIECDLATWGMWFKNIEKRRVAYDVINDIIISTVFLGLDHNFGYGPSEWYETMIFGGESEYQERYTTWNEAVAGHAKAVNKVRESIETN